MSKTINAKAISMIGFLVAMDIVLARFFTIHTWNLKIGFSFVPIVVAAIFYGPMAAGLVAAIGDICSAILFPVGPFFPGFTLTAFFTGAVYGIFLKKNTSVKNVICAEAIIQLLGSQLVNTFWISVLYGSPFGALFFTRIYQTMGMLIVETVIIILICKKLVPALKRAINNGN